MYARLGIGPILLLLAAVACPKPGATDRHTGVDTDVHDTDTRDTDERPDSAYEDGLYRFLAGQQHPETSLLESFVEHPDLPDAFGDYLRSSRPSFTYDNALGALAFLARGTDEDRARAIRLLDAMIDLQRPDGALPDVAHVATLQVGDRASTGNQAWAILAFLAAFEQLSEERYLLAAERIAAFVLDPEHDLLSPVGFGGYRLRTGAVGVATEHNLDLAPALQRLASHLPTTAGRLQPAEASLAARRARIYAESRFDPRDGLVYTGSAADGIGPDASVEPLDTHTWAPLALGRAKWLASLDRARRAPPAGFWVSSTACPTVEGPSYSDADVSEVWSEGLAQFRLAAALDDERYAIDALDASLARLQREAPSADGDGLVAACDTVRTGFGGSYFNSLAVGATAWGALASRGVDPFWFRPVDAGAQTHPLVDVPSVSLDVPPGRRVACRGDRPCFFEVSGTSTGVTTGRTLHLLVQPTSPVKLDRLFTQAVPAVVQPDGRWSAEGQLGDENSAVAPGDRLRIIAVVVEGARPDPQLTGITPDRVPDLATTSGVLELTID